MTEAAVGSDAGQRQDASAAAPPDDSLPRRGRWAGYGICVWSSLYVVPHVYWAAGGTIGMPGVFKEQGGWIIANVGASVVLCIAAVLGLALVQPWGRRLPRRLVLAVAAVGYVVPGLHVIYGYATKPFALAGRYELDLSPWARVDERKLILTDLLIFEPWFLVEAIMFIVASLYFARSTRTASAAVRD
ncbi:DUF3995 domain-containing protein [Streptomyces atratus]|nr:DUF3995 domain-containing protein [Streptomyces atratus]QBG38780.1 Atr19 [Streptomyces atratus]